MTKNLTKQLVHLPRLSLAADSLTELGFNHAERVIPAIHPGFALMKKK